MSDHRTQVLAAIPEDKRAKKVARTAAGVALVAFGSAGAIGSFVLAIMLVSRNAAIDKWAVIFMGLPFVGGLLMCVLGAHVWSSELVGAALKDLRATLLVWRRNGNGGAKP